MTEDPNHNLENIFPLYSGNNDSLLNSLCKTSEIICKWFSDAESIGPLPIDDEFKCALPDDCGTSLEILFSDIENLIYSSFNPVHPGSIAHLDPPPLAISILGDLIAAGLNNNLLAYELSPSISIIENSICKWFSSKLGFKENSGGIVASGGTLSNLNALVAARFYSGVEFDSDAIVLISEEAHTSFKKCIRIMGLNKNNLIRIKTNKKGSMDINHLKKTINKCFNEEKKIFCVVATLGTTIRGSIDPIEDISKICIEHNIWLHIDGSIGGIFAITNIHLNEINSVKSANSITINPQKILGITKTSSLLIVSDMNNLEKTFHTGLPYVSSNDKFINRGELGIQGSRPAEIIKLWLGLRFIGMQGIEKILLSAIEKRKFFEKNLNTNKYEIYSGPLHIISFLPIGMNNKESELWTLNIRNELFKKNFMLSRPLLNKKYLLRAVFGNYNTNFDYINELLGLINIK